MSASAQFLNPSAAAQRLGVSAKALRLYEQRGLVTPGRTAAGWRAYGPDEMARAAEIVALRALGLSLAQIARVLGDDPQGLEPALAAHQATLEGRIRQLAGAVEKVRDIGPVSRRASRRPPANWCACCDRPPSSASPSIFPGRGAANGSNCSDVRPLNYIIGPLGSGKTRLAKRLAETLPDAVFLGLDRLEHGGAAARARLDADPALKSRVDQTLAWLVEDGAAASEALVALLVGLESEGAAVVVVDMVEQGLDQAAQEAADRPPAPPRARRAAAVPAHALLRDPGPGRRGSPTRRSFSVPPITARRSASPRIPARQATRRSPPVWPRPKCGRGRKASSRGGRQVA